MLMDIDTLAAVQQERYRDFMHQAEQLRLLKTQNKADKKARTSATARKQTSLIAALQQMVSAVLPTHVRPLPPR